MNSRVAKVLRRVAAQQMQGKHERDVNFIKTRDEPKKVEWRENPNCKGQWLPKMNVYVIKGIHNEGTVRGRYRDLKAHYTANLMGKLFRPCRRQQVKVAAK